MWKVYFNFYELFYRTWKKLTDVEMKAKFYESLIEYGLFGTKPDDPIIDALLTSAMNSIDKSDEIHLRKSKSMEWNQNAVKDWWKISKQRKTEKNREKQKETEKNTWKKEIIEIIEKEEISMCDTHGPTPEERENKLRQTAATIQAERKWKIVLKHRNEKLNKTEPRNAELTHRCYWIAEVELEMIDKYIDRYKRLRDKIKENELQGLFFFNLSDRTLGDFLKRMNKFDWTFEEIVPRLAKQQEKETAIKKLKTIKNL